jgi:TldD protein
MLDAVPAPAGEMTVVLAPGMGGVLFHEAVGHPLEADAIDKEASVYRGLVGTKCASELINGVDDATIANGWGSFTFDDEGTPCSAQCCSSPRCRASRPSAAEKDGARPR